MLYKVYYKSEENVGEFSFCTPPNIFKVLESCWLMANFDFVDIKGKEESLNGKNSRIFFKRLHSKNFDIFYIKVK